MPGGRNSAREPLTSSPTSGKRGTTRDGSAPARSGGHAASVVGWREWIGLPALGIERIKAKLDTGARTSALHAFDLKRFEQEGEPWVAFVVHPLQRNDAILQPCRSPILDQRWVIASSGHRERRYVIATPLRIGDAEWPIEVTLTNRDEMGFRMLIGRTAMHHRLIVDPAGSYRLGRPRRQRRAISAARRKEAG